MLFNNIGSSMHDTLNSEVTYLSRFSITSENDCERIYSFSVSTSLRMRRIIVDLCCRR